MKNDDQRLSDALDIDTALPVPKFGRLDSLAYFFHLRRAIRIARTVYQYYS